MKTVAVHGAFDNLRSRDVRFLEEASKLGAVHVLLWSDAIVAAMTEKPLAFPLAERHYLIRVDPVCKECRADRHFFLRPGCPDDGCWPASRCLGRDRSR